MMMPEQMTLAIVRLTNGSRPEVYANMGRKSGRAAGAIRALQGAYKRVGTRMSCPQMVADWGDPRGEGC